MLRASVNLLNIGLNGICFIVTLWFLSFYLFTFQILTMESSVTAVSFLRGKLKFFKTRQAIFIYVAMFYLMFLFIQKPKFVPGAEFSSNKERPALNNQTYVGVSVLLTIQCPFVPLLSQSITNS